MLMLNIQLELMHFVVLHFAVGKRMDGLKIQVKEPNIGEHMQIVIYLLELYKI